MSLLVTLCLGAAWWMLADAEACAEKAGIAMCVGDKRDVARWRFRTRLRLASAVMWSVTAGLFWWRL